jgi:hypothetical protein
LAGAALATAGAVGAFGEQPARATNNAIAESDLILEIPFERPGSIAVDKPADSHESCQNQVSASQPVRALTALLVVVGLPSIIGKRTGGRKALVAMPLRV